MTDDRDIPWQVEMFRRSLKKRQKVELLLDLLGPLEDERSLLLTGGDNNGAINLKFRRAGGRWSWADLEADGLPAMAELLGEPVRHVRPERLPYPDEHFERLVVIDVHEHIRSVDSLNREIERVLAPGALAVVTTPNGDTGLPVARLKRWVGMGPEAYGHVVQGYRTWELEAMLEEAGLRPLRSGAYARFFTELAELAINFGYVKLLSGSGKEGGGNGEESGGRIAPGSEEQLRSVGNVYRIYSLIYPFVRAFSAFDRLLPGEGGYAVAVSARKPG